MGIRKEKAAKLKLVILDQAQKMTGKRSFDDLHVDQLCKKVKISKVTFFKYFPQKEDLLLYHFRLWCLDRVVELNQKPKEGSEALYLLFDRLSEECEKYPGMMLALVAYLSDLKRTPRPFPVKAEEKILLYPNVIDIHKVEILSLDQLIEKFVLEGIFKKQITKTSSTKDITNLLIGIFYGSILTAHLRQLSPLKITFRRNLDLVLKSL
ncbi:MAG TPA: TetR/AcrR family transcriptional regulator [Cyclobacteriaceae bacterium]|nr:TetR/AcrR family transcriptional regulator [Cyclobacteriaceae bacterium]